MRASVLSECKLDTVRLLDSYALLSSLPESRPFLPAELVSDWSGCLRDSGSTKTSDSELWCWC